MSLGAGLQNLVSPNKNHRLFGGLEKSFCSSSFVYGAFQHLGVSKNRGTPKWMVYNGKPGDDLGVPLFSETSISKKPNTSDLGGCEDTNERPSLYWFFSCRAFSKLFNLSTGQWLSRTISRTIRLNSAGESDKCRFLFFNKLIFASLVRKYTFITSCVKAPRIEDKLLIPCMKLRQSGLCFLRAPSYNARPEISISFSLSLSLSFPPTAGPQRHAGVTSES